MSAMKLETLSILLVAPSLVLSAVLRRELADLGAQHVSCCHGLQEALSHLQNNKTDLLISSMYFEDGDGIELITQIREDASLQHILFMLISAEERFEMLDPIRQAGVQAILPRPFTREALEHALSTCLYMLDGQALQVSGDDISEKKVLLVDDSRLARHHMMKVLVKVGLSPDNIIQAEDGRDAIALLEQGLVFDLVVTDYRMPHVDGEGLLQFIRQHDDYQQLPVIMVTSESNETRLGSIKRHGVTALMDKPFDGPYLKALLETHLLH